MGQTLTHGIYLPDEGERNCYSGLAANWQLLDGAVGTIAEHTTQIAGKAPAVHTHTKSDITDFPAYGTTAGTICEGNDSRLSDARTPVAHTHGKADITDLFNSANTWTGENTFSNLNPIILKNSNIEKGVQPTNSQAQSILFKDKNDSNVAYIRHFVNKSGTTNFNADGLEFSIANKFTNGALDPTGTNTSGTFRIGFWTDGQKYIYNEFRWRSSLIPFNNQTQDIGTSTNQWNNLYANNVNTQSVGGINPGALSLPDVTDGDPISTTGWSLTGARNTYTPTENGWFFIRVKGTASAKCSLNIHSGSYNDNYPTWVSYNDPTISLSTSLVVPAQKSVNLYVYIIAAEIEQLIFFPCLGNV